MASPRLNFAQQPKPRLSDITVQHDANATKGRYFIAHPGGDESELTYSILSSQTVIADHTAVADGHAGEGLGLLLLRALVADAISQGFKIVPLCPYVNAQRRKHPAWADAFQV